MVNRNSFHVDYIDKYLCVYLPCESLVYTLDGTCYVQDH